MKYEIVKDKKGRHQIGGDVPTDFKIPENKFLAGFQYLGFIDNKDPFFKWLPFKVNLIHPIYCDVYSVYLDYTNPNAPTIIRPKKTASVTSAFDSLNTDSKVIWKSVKVGLKAKEKINEFKSIGIVGTPDWLQDAKIPKCPKTKKPMKFLCQLGSFSGIKSKSSNVTTQFDYEKQYFEKLNFWGDGNLYIFIDPKSKTMCYTMQNT